MKKYHLNYKKNNFCIQLKIIIFKIQIQPQIDHLKNTVKTSLILNIKMRIKSNYQS